MGFGLGSISHAVGHAFKGAKHAVNDIGGKVKDTISDPKSLVTALFNPLIAANLQAFNKAMTSLFPKPVMPKPPASPATPSTPRAPGAGVGAGPTGTGGGGFGVQSPTLLTGARGAQPGSGMLGTNTLLGR
jgi:hypothetical protein